MPSIINRHDFNPNHAQSTEKPVVQPRPSVTCSMCRDWRNIDARPRCTSDRSPFSRQPREGGFGSCLWFRSLHKGVAVKEPEPKRLGPDDLPVGSPLRAKMAPVERPTPGRPVDAAHAQLLDRNAARKQA